MTDRPLLEKRLAVIDTCLSELRRLARPELLEVDVRERRFVEHTLQVAIQAALDAASHIVSDRRLGEPRTNRELFTLLEGDGWIEPALCGRLVQMAGFRNVVVHGYDAVDLAVVRDILASRLGDLEAFASGIRAALVARDADPTRCDPSSRSPRLA